MYHYYFPEVFQQLNRELQYHPELQELLNKENKGESDGIVRFAMMAKYCGVLLDGHFNDKELEKIAEICLNKLRERRIGIILPVDPSNPIVKE